MSCGSSACPGSRAFALDEIVARVLRFLPVGGVRVAAEVCCRWHRLCVGLAARYKKAVWRSHRDLALPLELRYYLRTPVLLGWARRRFPALACLGAMLAGPASDAPEWQPILADVKTRALVAWVLFKRGDPTCPPLGLADAHRFAQELAAADKKRRADEARHQGKFTLAHHELYMLKRLVNDEHAFDKLRRMRGRTGRSFGSLYASEETEAAPARATQGPGGLPWDGEAAHS